MYPSTNWPFKGELPLGQTRAAAWQLRNVTDAAFLLPDRHPRKQYLIDYVHRNLANWRKILDKNGHLMSGKRKVSGRQHWVCARQGSMWQYAWLVWSLDNTARKGWPAAIPIRDGAGDLILRLYEGKEEFKAPNGKVYRYDPRHAMPYSLAISLVQVEFLDNGRELDTDRGSITNNTGAMYYYTMVNVNHQHFFGNRKKAYEAWRAKLPGKVMRPEDWHLDPAFEATFREKPGGWHDYGNEACAAALARYDNPRARHMHRFVRDRIDKRRGDGPKRVRGIEYAR